MIDKISEDEFEQRMDAIFHDAGLSKEQKAALYKDVMNLLHSGMVSLPEIDAGDVKFFATVEGLLADGELDSRVPGHNAIERKKVLDALAELREGAKRHD